MDDQRLKDPKGAEYFDEVQNKLHFAATGQTAAEIIVIFGTGLRLAI